MPVDYVQVLADLDEEIALHKKELEELQAARPAIVALRNKFNPVAKAPYAGMGATAAIRDLLSNSDAWYSSGEILAHLVSKGWTTDSSDPPRIITSTLSQMKSVGLVDKQNDMWKSIPRTIPTSLQDAIERTPLSPQ